MTGGRYNLSEWALKHQALVLYFIIVSALIGAFSYQRLGQAEDPPFTFTVMVVRTFWPGATAHDVEQQVTDKIENKLQEVPLIDQLRSYSKPGESVVLFFVKESATPAQVFDTWYQVRKKIGDIRGLLPQGAQGPFFNDDFGDTYANIYALAGDGFSYAQLKEYGDRLRNELLRVPGVAKIDFFGEQEEKIYIEFSNAKLATLGVDPQAILQILQMQNAVAPSGVFHTAADKIYLRTSGAFDSIESIKDIAIHANNRLFRLGDVATVYRGYVDPPVSQMRFNGQTALGLGVTAVAGVNVVELGEKLTAEIARLQQRLPVGLDVSQVASMPQAVHRAIREFMSSLAEAVVIVLVVSLFTLGVRSGLIVAISIPLVLSITFLCMAMLDIGLHKISLGALILALGLLVDDAIIAIEMMVVKMEQGLDRIKAAAFAYTSTAFPMLTGTLITVAGFLPIAMARSSTGEYTRSIFQVSAIALLVSWVTAVVVIPYLGFKMLPERGHGPAKGGGGVFGRWLGGRWAAETQERRSGEIYDTPFYRSFRALVAGCLRHCNIVLAATLLVFLGAAASFRFVPKQFFPASGRPELIVDLRLPEGSSFHATLEQAKKLEGILEKDAGIEHFVGYMGAGSPRFYLAMDVQLQQSNFAQYVVLTKNNHEREAVRQRLLKVFEDDFPGLRGRVTRLENGPPVGFPIQFRVSGGDIPRVRELAYQVAGVLRTHPNVLDVQFDWDEPSKVVRIEIDQDKARMLGLSSLDLATLISNITSGYSVTQYREGDKQIEVLLRGAADERAQLRFLKDLAISTPKVKSVPLSQIAILKYELEDGVIWRYNRLPTITVRSDVVGAQGPDVSKELDSRLEAIRASLPLGYRIDMGGEIEDSAKGDASVAAGFPFMIFVVLTLLMVQLQSFAKTFMVLLTAPLGLIGVVAALLLFGKPFGFVAMLGTIALSGIIMRNSVILVDQIAQDIAHGNPPWDAIIDATVRRCRPIVLTAAAAVLALIPLVRSEFFGPMAVAMMGGLVIATLLTLIFLPALYAAWFRITPEELADENIVPITQ